VLVTALSVPHALGLPVRLASTIDHARIRGKLAR
jgi:hypothetical protein